MIEIDPLVTVVLPVHNAEASIARAIRSVLAQTYRNIELIVVDDGSTDGTRDVVAAFGQRVRLLEQAHRGVYAARNVGVEHAQGDLIAFIDSDDAWLPNRLSCQVPLMQRPEVGLVFGDVLHVTSDGALTGSSSFRVAPPRRGSAASAFVRSNFVPTIAVLVRRRCLENIGGFAESMPRSADYLAWFRIALRHELDYVARPVAHYTVRSGSLSSDLGQALEGRIRLFSEELARTTEPATCVLLRNLLFNLSLHLAFAALRGRARKTEHPLRLAWRTAIAVAGVHAPAWLAAFAFHQFQVRGL